MLSRNFSVTCKYEFDWPETVYLVGGVLMEGSGEFNSLHQFTISCSLIKSPPNPGLPWWRQLCAGCCRWERLCDGPRSDLPLTRSVLWSWKGYWTDQRQRLPFLGRGFFYCEVSHLITALFIPILSVLERKEHHPSPFIDLWINTNLSDGEVVCHFQWQWTVIGS